MCCPPALICDNMYQVLLRKPTCALLGRLFTGASQCIDLLISRWLSVSRLVDTHDPKPLTLIFLAWPAPPHDYGVWT